MSEKEFTDTIAPFYSFEQKELNAEREAMSLPVFKKAPKRSAATADKKALIQAYKKGMPAAKSSWYPYTEWRSYEWFNQGKILSQRGEGAP